MGAQGRGRHAAAAELLERLLDAAVDGRRGVVLARQLRHDEDRAPVLALQRAADVRLVVVALREQLANYTDPRHRGAAHRQAHLIRTWHLVELPRARVRHRRVASRMLLLALEALLLGDGLESAHRADGDAGDDEVAIRTVARLRPVGERREVLEPGVTTDGPRGRSR